MEALDAPVGLRRRLVSSFLVVILAAMGACGLPMWGTVQDTVFEWIDPAVMGLGIWQDQWELYGPEPDSANDALSAVVQFDDDVRVAWRSPDWRALSWTGKLRYFRHAEWVEGSRQDRNSATWAPLARYLARTVRHPTDESARPVRVELWRHWVHLPEPTEPLRSYDDPFPLESTQRYHVERLE